MSEYEYGEEIESRDGEDEAWDTNVFLFQLPNGFVSTVDSIDGLELFENVDILDVRVNVWSYHRKLQKPKPPEHIPYTKETFPLDNSGMIRHKIWSDTLFTKMFSIDCVSINYLSDTNGVHLISCHYQQALESLEWLNKDGTKSPCGTLKGDG